MKDTNKVQKVYHYITMVTNYTRALNQLLQPKKCIKLSGKIAAGPVKWDSTYHSGTMLAANWFKKHGTLQT